MVIQETLPASKQIMDPASLDFGLAVETEPGEFPGPVSDIPAPALTMGPRVVRQATSFVHLGDSGSVSYNPDGTHTQLTWELQDFGWAHATSVGDCGAGVEMWISRTQQSIDGKKSASGKVNVTWLKYEHKAGYAESEGNYFGREVFFLAHVCFKHCTIYMVLTKSLSLMVRMMTC